MTDKIYDLPGGGKIRGSDAWAVLKDMIEKQHPEMLQKIDVMLLLPFAAENLGNRPSLNARRSSSGDPIHHSPTNSTQSDGGAK